jgi:hypothetical protein
MDKQVLTSGASSESGERYAIGMLHGGMALNINKYI